MNFIEFCNENALLSQQSAMIKCYASNEEFYAIMRKEYLIIFKIWDEIWMLIDEINVAEWFRVESPSLARCKEGDLPLLNFSNLTCMGPTLQ